MKSNFSAGKRIEYNFGTFNPAAMLKIKKDLNRISPREPEKGMLISEVKLIHASFIKLNSNIDEFKFKQARDFKELKIELQEMKKVLKNFNKK